MRSGFRILSCAATLLVFFLPGWTPALSAAEKAGPTNSPPKADETNDSVSTQTLRSYLQLQEQLHETLLTIEKTRKDTEAAARANSEAIALRLGAIEQALGTQQIHEVNLLQNSNRVT